MGNCRKYEDWAGSPVGGTEPPEHLLAHVPACDDCTETAARLAVDLSRLERALGSLPEPALPSDFAARVMQAVPPARWESKGFRAWAIPAAAAAVLTTAAAALLHPLPTGLVEHSVVLSALRAPLSTIGEVSRILGAGVSSLNAQLSLPGGAAIPLVAGLALAFGLRGLARRPARRSVRARG